MKKRIMLSGIIALFLSAAAFAQPSVTIVGNSIDLALSRGYIDNLEASGIDATTIMAADLPSHKGDANIIILGGQNAPEGIGPAVNELLSASEKKEVLSAPDAKAVVVIANAWTVKQKVMIFAGYEKEQTRKAFADAQGDIMKSLRFNESLYPQDNADTKAKAPPLDATQPYTEVSAYEAMALKKEVPDLEIIDVRGKPLYEAGHIPGAVNMPVRSIEQNLQALNKNTTYLLYCGGNSESIKAGSMMASNGYNKIYRLVDGYMAWRKAGYEKAVTQVNP
jgi:rhodanese-related sulfurtransferase